MDAASTWINHLKAYVPDIEELLPPGVEAKELDEWERQAGVKLPEEFRTLYLAHNGEGDSLCGVMAGFGWMTLESIHRNWKGLQSSAYSILSNQKDQILEGPYRSGWIPFADDGGGSFLVMDLMPGPAGSYGQIITIDHDSDISYVLAESLSGFLDFVVNGFAKGQLVLDEEEDAEEGERVISWKSGHLFGDVLALTGTAGDAYADSIALHGFWAEYFKDELVEDRISTQTLAKTRMVFIKANEGEKFDEVSLEPLKHMGNLKELIIHANNIASFEPLREVSSLAKVIIGSKAFQETDLPYLQEAGSVKELTLVGLSLQDVEALEKLKSLKKLRLYKGSIQNLDSIGNLTNLTELSLDKMEVGTLDYLSRLTKLTELELKNVPISHLGFLRSLTKLRVFSTDRKAVDESQLELVCGLSKLQELTYPMGDMALVKRCAQVKEVNIDVVNLTNVKDLENSSVKSVHLTNPRSEEEAERVIAEIETYCKLSSCGWSQTWEE
ncbi:SMI1/KNR4 family protein [Gorillibacterium sp. CAU 1737]|uniref:SMI1/KNR4 family protein n=1 Tax=Gorillibacterium sp. CAU 1737 TaxID=3140362 RepID=UPI00326077BE